MSPEVCGALGCHNTHGVLKVTDEKGRTRSLCPEHQHQFIAKPKI